MNNQLWGILTVVFCLACSYLSWTYRRKDRYNIAMLLLMLSGFALRLFTASDLFLHPWDEAFHAVVAKNMIHHPFVPTLYENPVLPYDKCSWTNNHIWLHKQPLPLWGMSLSLFLFGINEIALRLPSVLLTTIGIWLTFYIGSYLFDKRTGYIAAFLYSINGLIIEMTAGRVPTDHIDIFFLFFVELSVFFSILFCQRKNAVYNILTGVSIGAAILCKWLPALIVLPIWILLVLDSEKFTIKSIIIHFLVLTSVITLTCLPWQIYIYHAFPIEAAWEGSYNVKHLTQVIEEHAEPYYFYLNQLRINYSEIIYLPLFWFTWRVLKNIKDLKRSAVLIWLAIPLLFFSAIVTKMQGYILFTAPALFLITAEFWVYLTGIDSDGLKKWCIYLVIILLIALPVRYAIERIKPFSERERNPEWAAKLRKLSKELPPKAVLFNCNHHIEAMFYLNSPVYDDMPTADMMDKLEKQGYSIFINDRGDIPKSILSQKSVKRVNLSD